MSGLDLTGLRPDLEPFLLVDECEIWRDASGALDDEVDPVTGSVIGPVPDSTLVVTTAAKFKLTKRLPVAAPEGGVPTDVANYELKIPVASALPHAGDRVMVTVCGHDPDLVGKWLRVTEVGHGTFALFRLVSCEMRERVSDRP